MTGGQVTVPLVIRTANGGGLGFGAQHSQAVENWALTIPGLKIVAPSTPADVIGLMASRRSAATTRWSSSSTRACSRARARRAGGARRRAGQAAVVRGAPTSPWWPWRPPCRIALAAADRLARRGHPGRGRRPAVLNY